MTTPTTQTPAQQAEAFREEIRELFKNLHINLGGQIATMDEEIQSQHSELVEIRATLQNMREGLTHASQPAPTMNADGENFTATMIEREKKKGKYYFKMKGGTYTKHGITIWPEILEELGLTDAEYSEDDTHKLNPPINVHVSWEWYKDEESGEQKKRRKITGKA